MCRFFAWLGSDWRLPLSAGLLVAAVFITSTTGLAILESAWRDSIRADFARRQAAVDAKVRAMPAVVEPRVPQMVAKVITPTPGT